MLNKQLELRMIFEVFGEFCSYSCAMTLESDRLLGEIVQKSGKIVTAWACAGDFDPAGLVSNFCEIEWPRKSGKRLQVPEADRAGWFTLDEARAKMNSAQTPFLFRLAAILASDGLTGKSG